MYQQRHICHDAEIIYSQKDYPAGRLQFIIVFLSAVVAMEEYSMVYRIQL